LLAKKRNSGFIEVMKKVILRIVIVAVVLLIVAVVAVVLSLDGIVKSQVQKIGSKLTKVEVKLDTVSLSLMSGSGKIGGLSVGNPEGYKTPQSITVSNASLVLQPKSLLSDKIIINKIEVVAPEITFEGGLSANNLSKLKANVNETDSQTPASQSEAKSEGKSGKKLEVDDFLITGARVHLNFTGVLTGPLTVTIPEIHLTDLGKNGEGITKAELTQKILTAIEQAAVKAAAEHAGDIAKGATGLIKGMGGSTSNTVNAVGKGIGDLFKKK
jgi:hypothetical protein